MILRPWVLDIFLGVPFGAGKLATELQEFQMRHGSEAVKQAVNFAMASGYSLSEITLAMTKMASAGIAFAQAMGSFGAAFSDLDCVHTCMTGRVIVDYNFANDKVLFSCAECREEIVTFKRVEVAGVSSVTEINRFLDKAILQHECPPPVRLIRV